MKNLVAFLIFCSICIFGQTKQFFYEYKSIPDSTDRANVWTDMMVLQVGKDKSEFYSLEKYKVDSTMLADSKKGIYSMPPDKTLNYDRTKKSVASNNLVQIKFVGDTKFNVTENPKLNWKLVPEFSTILSHKVQKATTEYRGRKWTAWFSQQIPIQDGPYKFSGLPGLILMLEDTGKNHVFKLVGIKNGIENFEYPEMKTYDQELFVNYPQYVKAFKNNRANPVAHLAGKIPDQTDSEGHFRTGDEIIKSIEKYQKERIAKDNNIIEIDLIK